ncbi:MAG TPA: aliphatic sulfonate ABC transporter substrate-binding protein [Solirubrobacterales bacterium]|nr:aliphatic sulfonate ABC transporter substrate-binding protein [Solirubrobacterales bacterium]
MNATHPTSTRQWRILLVLAALAASIMLIACGGDSDSSDSTADASPSTSADTTGASTTTASSTAPETITIGYQLIPNGDLIVKSEGYLEQAFPDSTIKWVKFDSGGDVNTAVAGGAIDFGLAGSSPVSNGLASGIEYKVPWIHDVIGTAESLVATSDSGVTDVAGLKGKKVATPLASTSHYSLLVALKDAGLKPTDVQVVDLEPEAILAAWTRGDIDAAYVWSPTLDELKADGGVVLTDSAQLAKQGEVTADLAVVTNEFADQYPDAVQTWVDAQNRAVELYKSDPDAAAAAIASELSIEPAEALKQTKGLTFLTAEEQSKPRYLGTEAAPGGLAGNLQAAAEFLSSLGQLEGEATPEKFKDGLAPQYVNAVSGG